jgi:hypothetical protein
VIVADELTPRQIDALRNLSSKRAGKDVGFINIADAQALTHLGLASRSREGWDITGDGAARLAAADLGSRATGKSKDR